MGSGYAKKKKEAKMMRQKFKEMQDKLKDETATGTAGNGLSHSHSMANTR